MIRRAASNALKLNEGLGERGGYILEGIFAELDTLNRNKRIYPKDEYLKHLEYLRDDLKNGEPILGELDHPDDRFEVKLKEASHRVIDLWYDATTNNVMGKIELLDTPNGKIAKSLVDQGIPLHISSRAAGTVGSDSKVSIQQIYTYDLVCKPGFAGAVLHRVNESAGEKTYDETAMKFLTESEKNEAKKAETNAAKDFGILDEELSIVETNANVNLRSNVAKMQENDNSDMNTNSNKEKELDEKKKSIKSEGDPTAQMKSVFEADDEEEKDKEEGDDKDKEEGDDDGVKIIDVEAVTADDDDVDIKDVEGDKEGDDDSDDSDDDSKSDDEDSKDDSEEEKTDECDASDKDDKSNEGNEGDADKEDTKNALFDCKDIKERKEKFEDKIDDLIDTIKRKGESAKKNESLTISKYPVSAMLSGENFKEFMNLNESQKSNVIAYLGDKGVFTPEAINENWKSGIDYKKPTEVWLTHAPADYRALYESSNETVKDSIRKTAQFCLFENQRDVNRFWENTGLMEAQQRRMLNEKFINNLPKINESVQESGLPYSKDFINMVADMASEYNN